VKSSMSELEQALEASRAGARAKKGASPPLVPKTRKCGVRRRHPPQSRAQDNLREEPYTHIYAKSGTADAHLSVATHRRKSSKQMSTADEIIALR